MRGSSRDDDGRGDRIPSDLRALRWDRSTQESIVVAGRQHDSYV